MEFIKLEKTDHGAVARMSGMASAIIKEVFDPIVGSEQNDYMIAMFQSVEAINGQLEQGYNYYFVQMEGSDIGFLAFYPRGKALYLSKFYLKKEERKKGYSREMMEFVKQNAASLGLEAIELNVNRFNEAVEVYKKLEMSIIREEKNDIGKGFFMDDYVFQLVL